MFYFVYKHKSQSFSFECEDFSLVAFFENNSTFWMYITSVIGIIFFFVLFSFFESKIKVLCIFLGNALEFEACWLVVTSLRLCLVWLWHKLGCHMFKYTYCIILYFPDNYFKTCLYIVSCFLKHINFLKTCYLNLILVLSKQRHHNVFKHFTSEKWNPTHYVWKL